MFGCCVCIIVCAHYNMCTCVCVLHRHNNSLGTQHMFCKNCWWPIRLFTEYTYNTYAMISMWSTLLLCSVRIFHFIFHFNFYQLIHCVHSAITNSIFCSLFVVWLVSSIIFMWNFDYISHVVCNHTVVDILWARIWLVRVIEHIELGEQYEWEW